MTRQDYIQFAEMIAARVGYAKNEDPPYDLDTIKSVANGMCGIFSRDNYNFNRQRFLTACNLE